MSYACPVPTPVSCPASPLKEGNVPHDVPSGFSCYVARAVLDQLAGNEIEDSTGDKRGDLGDTAPTDVEIGQHSGAMVASQCVAKASTQRGNIQSQSGVGATSGTVPVTGQFVELLVERGCMQNAQRVVGGFEVQWEIRCQ